MTPIPRKLRKQLAADPEYTVCMVTGEKGTRSDPIQWHHEMIYASNQVQERFAILAIKRSIHDMARNKEVREKLEWIMVNRMTEADFDRYGKAIDYRHRRAYLNAKYGVWVPKIPVGYPTGNRTTIETEPEYAGIDYPFLRSESTESLSSVWTPSI